MRRRRGPRTASSFDGQQRSTAVYHAFGDHSKETYYVDLGALVTDSELDDDHLRYEKASSFNRRFPNVGAMAEARIAKVSTLVDALAWQQWLNFLPDPEKENLVELKEGQLPGFSNYEIPALRLDRSAKDDLAAVAKIFETINRTGQRLATFDLMVARLYPSSFYLKSQWDAARESFEIFAQFNLDEDDGIEVLKVIALREHLRQRAAGERLTVKGVREGDVLALPSDLVIQEWPLAVRALVSALQFVSTRCGAVHKTLLPAPALLLVLADALHPETPQRDGLESDLERWYWATMFRQEYAQGANTQAVRDAQEIRAWQQDADATPARINAFRVDSDALLDGRRRNEQLLRGILGLSVARDARDWVTDVRFQETAEALEAHHVFPSAFLQDHYRGEKDPVVNFCVLTKSTNASLRDKIPKDVLLDPAVKHAAVTSHVAIDLTHLKEDAAVAGDPAAYIQRFLEGRATALEPLMYEVVGVSTTAT